MPKRYKNGVTRWSGKEIADAMGYEWFERLTWPQEELMRTYADIHNNPKPGYVEVTGHAIGMSRRLTAKGFLEEPNGSGMGWRISDLGWRWLKRSWNIEKREAQDARS